MMKMDKETRRKWENLFKLPCFKLKLNNSPMLYAMAVNSFKYSLSSMEIELLCILFKLEAGQ